MGAFEEVSIQKMMVADAALRDGVFYDLIGRQLNEDMRDQTVQQFRQRYHVARSQADRVAKVAKTFLQSVSQHISVQELTYWQRYVNWAAQLHEIGLNIAHTAYHKHTAYILENADMPGFSRKEQQLLAALTLGQRGDLRKMPEFVGDNQMMWFAILTLRLAVLFCRARLPLDLPNNTQLRHDPSTQQFVLRLTQNWLDENPLAADALAFEAEQWKKINMDFVVQAQ